MGRSERKRRFEWYLGELIVFFKSLAIDGCFTRHDMISVRIPFGPDSAVNSDARSRCI